MKLLIFILFFSVSVLAQISPGDLTKAHAKLEGMSNCTKCHELGEQVYNSKCLDCHTEIRSLINAKRGYHSSSDVKGKDCWSCHSEHHGRNFRIINFNPSGFDHSKTGYVLKGKHAEIDCEDCHNSKFIDYSKLKHTGKTYLGLSKECGSCHEDFHLGKLGSNCTECHSNESFKPAVGFDHAKTNFKLTGAHQNVNCVSCHSLTEKNGKEFQTFETKNFSNCNSCHNDPHKTAFGNDCKSCHLTSSFQRIREGAFDHSKTNFPLLGKHKLVGCNDCHKGGISNKPKFEKCIDCHSDFHKGDFIVDNKPVDCVKCHSVEGFKPSLFTVVDHTETNFPLTGAHLAVPCQSCHYEDSKWKFSDLKKYCIDCHKDVHGNELSEKFLPEDDCTFCHETTNWSTISFDHSSTKFDLIGKHGSVQCSGCHLEEDQTGENKFRFKSLNSGCKICHTDVHFDQFETEDDLYCSRCHTFENWQPDKFDHNKTEFSLRGAHQKLDCSRCHKPVEEDGNIFIKYKLEEFKCAACHS